LELVKSYSHLYSLNFPLDKLVQGKTEKLGEMQLYISSFTVLERTWITFLITIVAAVIKTLCLWLISVIVIDRVISKPLKKLTTDIQDFDIETVHQVTPKQSTQLDGKDDELYTLKRSFHSFCSAMVDRNRLLKNRNMEVEEYKVNLEQKVEERTQFLNEALVELANANQVKVIFSPP